MSNTLLAANLTLANYQKLISALCADRVPAVVFEDVTLLISPTGAVTTLGATKYPTPEDMIKFKNWLIVKYGKMLTDLPSGTGLHTSANNIVGQIGNEDWQAIIDNYNITIKITNHETNTILITISGARLKLSGDETPASALNTLPNTVAITAYCDILIRALDFLAKHVVVKPAPIIENRGMYQNLSTRPERMNMSKEQIQSENKMDALLTLHNTVDELESQLNNDK